MYVYVYIHIFVYLFTCYSYRDMGPCRRPTRTECRRPSHEPGDMVQSVKLVRFLACWTAKVKAGPRTTG